MCGQLPRRPNAISTQPLYTQRLALPQILLPPLSKMCITKLSKHSACGHWSCEIKTPCKEGRNFSNCPSFTEGKARNAAKHPQELAKEKTCPKCDKKDDYDGKKIRMVKGSVNATKFGCGPSVSLSSPPCLYYVTGPVWRLGFDRKGDVLTSEAFRGRTLGLLWERRRGSMGQRRNQVRWN